MKLLLFAVILSFLAGAWRWIAGRRPETFGLANEFEGLHANGRISLFPDSDLPTGTGGKRLYLFAAKSETVGNAAIAGVNDIPIGIFGDSTEIGVIGFGEVSDLSMPVVVRLLGSSGVDTQLVSINSDVSAWDYLVPDANGYARTLPTTGPVYFLNRDHDAHHVLSENRNRDRVRDLPAEGPRVTSKDRGFLCPVQDDAGY